MEYIRDKKRRFFQIISLPIIWSVLIPMVVFDLWMEFYHRVCFPMYGIKYIKRGSYIRIDRYKLKYLVWYEKLGCVYCGYANGLARYWVAIASRTELYWCGIAHESVRGLKVSKYDKKFARYGDKEEFDKRYGKA